MSSKDSNMHNLISHLSVLNLIWILGIYFFTLSFQQVSRRMGPEITLKLANKLN